MKRIILFICCLHVVILYAQYPYTNIYPNVTRVSFSKSSQQVYNIGKGHSRKILNIFKKADKNNDNSISYAELQNYQYWLINNFQYKSNATALKPDDFISQGGGDCEDFSIMTCCMLNYHGIIAYVATYGRVTPNKHAVCMVRINDLPPPGFLYYQITNWDIPDGNYVPVDYQTIGGLHAIDRRWKIAYFNKPKEMYGKYM